KTKTKKTKEPIVPPVPPTPTGIFSEQYYSTILNKLVKLPGLCTQMQFYAPTIKGYPLKIEVTAGQSSYILGTIQIYIKDTTQIAFEESKRSQDEETVSSPVSKPKKRTTAT